LPATPPRCRCGPARSTSRSRCTCSTTCPTRPPPSASCAGSPAPAAACWSSSNGADHLHGLHALLPRRGERRLDLDAGEALLAAEFGRVTREDLTAELDLPDASAIEAYARSIPVTPPAALPPGPYRIRTHTGIVLART
jgi:hypothetical protein